MHPALDGPRRCPGGETAGAQWARVAVGFAARIPDLDPAAGVDLAAFARREELVSRAAIRIRLGIVAELFMARSEERRVGKECRARWSPDLCEGKNVD